jgi:intermediate peptidase
MLASLIRVQRRPRPAVASLLLRAALDHASTLQSTLRYPKRLLSTGTSTCNTLPSNPRQPGLFTIPGLVKPKDFLRLAHEAMRTSDQLRESINLADGMVVSTHEQALDVLYRLDQISKTVCNVIDAAELCRSAHASEEWRDMAQRVFSILQEYIATLNTDQALYESLRQVTESPVFQILSPEEQRFASLLQREFELDGIHLPDEERHNAKHLHTHVTNLETMFANNITNAQKTFTVNAEVTEETIPKHVLQANGAIYQENGKMIELVTDSPIAHSLSSFAASGDLRKQVHMESMTACPENLDVLDNLIKVRHELSTTLGFESYADRFLQDKMAKSQEHVGKFLTQLQQHIAPAYKRDMEVLAYVKQQVEGNSVIEPWDVKYYVKQIKAQKGLDPAQLAPYLSLENCLDGMQVLIQQLFGITMQEEPMQDEERWDSVESLPPPPFEERIRKFVFQDDEERNLGTMYLDLHPRKGKYTHAAHFTVRCGCVVDGPDSDYQSPIVALVCNMNTGEASFSSHQEVETLFHEFGHALHSLLSRTNFQHMSGTRAAMDFVETPSHWMENYVWDPQFLPLLARTTSGEPIPEAMISSLRESHKLFKCLEMQNQIVLAMFDQHIFGAASSSSAASTTDIWSALHRQHAVPYAEGTHWHSNVGHLVTYGAGYYGYLYSQVFASDIWNQLFQQQSLERKSGEQIWKKMLIHGGAKDANLMLKDLLGREPTVDNFLKTLKV